MIEAGAAPSYWLTRLCFQKALAFVYLIAFLVTANQFRALIGEHGLLPAQLFMKRVSPWEAPSLFWFVSSDRFMTLVAWCGAALAAFALTGFSERFGIWVSAAVWFLLWIFYLSFVNIGQVFYGFGWESLLLEVGFLAIFMGSADVQPPAVLIWLLRWVLFRMMFGAGLIKLRGDACWRDLTAMVYHYETQPLPNPLSWYFHRLPVWFHKIEVLFTHFVEIIAPWGVFLFRPFVYIAGVLTVFFQVSLILSGNLSWLNYLTIVVAISCFDDAFLSKFIPVTPGGFSEPTALRAGVLIGLTCMILLLSVRPALNLISRRQMMNAAFEPFHLVNTYGAFGSITRKRYEVIIEGTDEVVLGPSTKWREYEFKGKPGDVARAPCIVAPYHRRLDWLMWFAAMNDTRYHPWILNLAAKLLQNDREALRLMDKNPFPDRPPRYIRAELYLYRFTDPREKKETGHWWSRTRVESYFPPLSLEDPAFKRLLQTQGWIAGN